MFSANLRILGAPRNEPLYKEADVAADLHVDYQSDVLPKTATSLVSPADKYAGV